MNTLKLPSQIVNQMKSVNWKTQYLAKNDLDLMHASVNAKIIIYSAMNCGNIKPVVKKLNN